MHLESINNTVELSSHIQNDPHKKYHSALHDNDSAGSVTLDANQKESKKMNKQKFNINAVQLNPLSSSKLMKAQTNLVQLSGHESINSTIEIHQKKPIKSKAEKKDLFELHYQSNEKPIN